MAFHIACVARVKVDEVRVVCQRRVAEQQGACRRESVREVGITGCFGRSAVRFEYSECRKRNYIRFRYLTCAILPD
jgi:hypothetical protein